MLSHYLHFDDETLRCVCVCKTERLCAICANHVLGRLRVCAGRGWLYDRPPVRHVHQRKCVCVCVQDGMCVSICLESIFVSVISVCMRHKCMSSTTDVI